MKELDIAAEFEKLFPLSKLSDEEMVEHAISNRQYRGDGKIPERAVKHIDMTFEEFIRKTGAVPLEDVIRDLESKLNQ